MERAERGLYTVQKPDSRDLSQRSGSPSTVLSHSVACTLGVM